jgi:8-oxo-dGTP pyrophosphatase MutT (NUDIX family)
MIDDKQINSFIKFLQDRLKKTLPGIEAQKIMAPFYGDIFYRKFKPSYTAYNSAVLSLLTFQDAKLNILLTLRSKKIKHSGQISFPGGRSENNETPEQTALRETREEIGIDTSDIKLLGRLSDLYVHPTDTIIIPVVAYKKNVEGIKINNDEVEDVFQVPFEKFLDNKFRKTETWKLNGKEVNVPLWDIYPTTPLWGATSMILMELVFLYNEFLNNR